MADYSVTIKVSGSSASHVHHHLQTAFGTAVARQAVITTWGSHDLYHDHCRELGHFGCVHWTDDDIESRCRELGIPATPELLKEVKARTNHIDDGMTELGWEVIESAILEAFDDISGR
jgi:hypothetical protein